MKAIPRSSSRLALGLCVLFLAFAALLAAAIPREASEAAQLWRMNFFPRPGGIHVEEINDAFMRLATLKLGGFLLLGAVFLAWTAAVTRQARSAPERELDFTPIQAATSWIIPSRPFQRTLRQMEVLWQAGAPASAGDWRTAPLPRWRLRAWWTLYWLSQPLPRFNDLLLVAAGRTATSMQAWGALIGGPDIPVWLSLLGDVLGVPAAIAAAWVVWNIQGRIDRLTLGETKS